MLDMRWSTGWTEGFGSTSVRNLVDANVNQQIGESWCGKTSPQYEAGPNDRFKHNKGLFLS